MTFEELQQIITINNIPKDVHLISDNGWECDITGVNGWECDITGVNGLDYYKDKNLIIFTQTQTPEGHKVMHPYYGERTQLKGKLTNERN